MDKKVIHPLNRIKAGMGQALHRDDIEQRYIIGKDAVQAEEEVEVPGFFYIHMEEELAGMNPGIGAAAAGDYNREFKDPADRTFHNFLHAQLVGLPLPSKILCSLISDMYEISQMISGFILLS